MSLIPFPHYPLGDNTVDSNGSALFQAGYIRKSDTVAIGTGDYTIEAWVYCDLTETYNSIASIDTLSDFAVYLRSTGRIQVYCGGNNLIFASGPAASANTWTHVAVVRNSGTTEVFIDGVSTGTSASLNASIPTDILAIGSDRENSLAHPFAGLMTMIRVSTSAKYTSTFTPTTDYGVDGDTVLLLASLDSGSTFENVEGSTVTEEGTIIPSAAHPDNAIYDFVTNTTDWEVPTSISVVNNGDYSWSNTTVSNVTSQDSNDIDTGTHTFANLESMDELDFIFGGFSAADFDGSTTGRVILEVESQWKNVDVSGAAMRFNVFAVENGTDSGNDNAQGTLSVGTTSNVDRNFDPGTTLTAAGLVAGNSGLRLFIREFDTNPFNGRVLIDYVQMRVTYLYKT